MRKNPINKITKSLRSTRKQIWNKKYKAAVQTQPNFDVDDKNWRKIKPALKAARSKTFQETYGKPNAVILESWHEVAGILKGKKINALAYQKQVRKGWERRLKRQIKLASKKPRPKA